MIIIPMVMLGFIYVILPGAFVFFYGSKHVKASCEKYDPTVRWTDQCPLPVLAVSLWLAFSALTMLMMAVAFKGILPVFGTFVVGPLGSGLCVLLALLWIYCAWALYRLETHAPWLVVGVIMLFCISTSIPIPVMTSWRFIHCWLPPEQIAQISKFNFLKGPRWRGLCGAVLLMVIYSTCEDISRSRCCINNRNH